MHSSISYKQYYRKTSNKSHTLEGMEIVDVVGTSPVGTTSLFST